MSKIKNLSFICWKWSIFLTVGIWLDLIRSVLILAQIDFNLHLSARITSFSSEGQTWLDLFWSVLICLDLIWYVCFGLGKFKFHNGNSQNVQGSYFKVHIKQLISVIRIVRQVGNLHTGISRFPLIMCGQKKNCKSKNRVNRGYLVVVKGRKVG